MRVRIKIDAVLHFNPHLRGDDSSISIRGDIQTELATISEIRRCFAAEEMRR